jgi:hypothetical protein
MIAPALRAYALEAGCSLYVHKIVNLFTDPSTPPAKNAQFLFESTTCDRVPKPSPCHTTAANGYWSNGSQEYEPLICDLWSRIETRAADRITPHNRDFGRFSCCDNGTGQN